MRRNLELILVLALAGFGSMSVHGAESYRVAQDGSITGTFPTAENHQREIILRFGMPPTTPAKRWTEGQALRTLWVTNGILYTQTVLLTELPGEMKTTARTNTTPILLINIEGENTNSEYADAFATLQVEVGNRPASLEFTNRTVWVHGELGGFTLGSLEIPESGVRAAEGQALEFYGGIPPSLKGSMTLKVPLVSLADDANGFNRLIDLEFDAAFRRTVRSGAGIPAGAHPLNFVPSP